MTRDRLFVWLGAVASLVVVVLWALRPNLDNSLDWPLALLSAQRVAQGGVPFVDVNVLYGPLGHELAGLALRHWTGLPADGLQAYFGLLGALEVLLVAWMASTVALPGPTRALLVLSSVLAISLASYSGAAMLVVLLALALAPVAFDGPAESWSSRLAVVMLPVLGVALVGIRLNFGVYLLAAGGGTVLFALARREAGARGRLVAAIVGLVVGVGLLAVHLTLRGNGPAWLAEMQAYLPRFDSRRVPLLESIDGLEAKVVLAILGAQVLGVLATWMSEGRRASDVFGGLLFFALVSYAITRFDVQHWYGALLVGALVLARGSEVRKAALPRAIGGLALATVLLFSLSGLKVGVSAALYLLRHERGAVHGEGRYVARSGEVRVVHRAVGLDPKVAEFVTALESLLGPSDGVFIASEPEACACTLDPCANLLLYPALGRVPEIRDWMIDTAFVPYDDVQARMVASLESRPPAWVILEDRTGHVHRPGYAPPSHRLADWVRAHYEVKLEVDSGERTYRAFRRRE